MRFPVSVNRLALDADGRVILDDAELEKLAGEFEIVLAGGPSNNGCGSSPQSNTNCSNSNCHDNTNGGCQNSSCTHTTNYNCQNQLEFDPP